MKLGGQVAAVTGASSGIGLAVAERLAAEGANVIMIDINEAGLKAAAARIGNRTTYPLVLDISQDSQVERALSGKVEELGGLHILVNAAAIWSKHAFDEMLFEEWRRIQAVNADGTFLIAQAAYRMMKAAGYGRIVNFASTMFAKPPVGWAHYASSKGAVVGLTRAIAVEGGRFGITANVIAPGMIITEGALRSVDQSTIESYVAVQPVPRPGAPSDIVEAVMFLTSREAGFTTGQTFYVNGGLNFG